MTVDQSASLVIQTPKGQLVVEAIAQGALRVRYGPALVDETSPILTNISTVPTTIDGNKISTERMSAIFDDKTGVLRFFDRERLILEESLGGRKSTPSQIQGQLTHIAQVAFESPEDERLYGTGQFQDGFLDIRDLPRRLTQVNTQIALPFYVSSKGYGLLWHNLGMTDLNPADEKVSLTPGEIGKTTVEEVISSVGTQVITRVEQTFEAEFTTTYSGRHAMMLDIGQSMAENWQVIVDDITVVDFNNQWLPPTTSWFQDLTQGTHRVRVKGFTSNKPSIHWRPASSQTVLRSPVSNGVDYIVFAGGAEEVIRTYRLLSGQAPLLPLWAFGFIQCRERYTSSDHLIDTVCQFRKCELPIDMIVQDWMYWGKYGWNAMQWDEEHYPDPTGLVRQLHELDARLMVSVWSRIEQSTQLGQEFSAKKLFIPGTDWVDFFNPAAREFFWTNFSKRMLVHGIDAWWLDANEPQNDALANAETHAGPGDLHRNMYPLLVNQTVYEGQRREVPDRRVCILSRSGFLGQHRYSSITWSGDVGNDWDTLARQIVGGLNQMVSGLPYWTTDTGGFFRPKSQYTDEAFHQRYLRWLQYSTFTPVMRVHGFQTETEPWHYGDKVEGIQRTYVDLRYRLLPYIYSCAAMITFHGSTLMRPLIMDFAHDSKALDQKYQYMFGPAFLVSPVLDYSEKWRVYAPMTNGGWYDWWTSKRLAGGEEHEIPAPLDQIPLLIRAGSIIPMGPRKQSTAEPTRDLDIRVFPGVHADFDLYEDSGTDYGYERGERSIIRLQWKDEARKFSIARRDGSYPDMVFEREFTIHVVGFEAKRVVYLGDEIHVDFAH